MKSFLDFNDQHYIGLTEESVGELISEDFSGAVAKLAGTEIKTVGPNNISKEYAGKSFYVKDSSGEWEIHVYSSSIRITDLHFALQRGKKSPVVSFYGQGGMNENIGIAVQALFGQMKAWGELVNYANQNKGGTIRYEDMVVHIQVIQEQSHKIFSPWAVSRIKRLTAEPTKWKMLDVVKALVNGQFSFLEQSHKYTDDYAFDAANNHGKIKSLPPLPLAIEMLRESGWNVWSTKDGSKHTVDFGPYTNLSYRMVFDIHGKPRIQV